MSGLAIDRMAERRNDIEWLADVFSRPQTQILAVHRGRILVSESGSALFRLTASQTPESLEYSAFLGRLESRDYFAVSIDAGQMEQLVEETGGQLTGFRQVIPRLPAEEASLAAYARALDLWQSAHRFCGRCGSPTNADSGGFRRQCGNAECATQHFPRLDPAVITVVAHDGRCLLGRQPGWPEGRYSTLAGFVEPAESLEDAVRREVLEESGVKVGTVAYHSSQPWPFPSSLMVGFFAQAIDDKINRGDELEDVQWFAIDELSRAVKSRDVLLPYRSSVSYRLIADWVKQVHDVDIASWRT